MSLLESIATWLNKSPWLNLVSMVVGLLGLALSVYFFLKSRSRVIPRYQMASASLLSQGAKTIQGLKITFENRALEQLSISTFSFWNQGDKVLESSDIAAADPLMIVLPPNVAILQVRIVHQTALGNNVTTKVRLGEPQVDISFDYLSHNEGFTIEVFHDSTTGDDACISGTIKGFGRPQLAGKTDDPVTDALLEPVFNWIFRITGRRKAFMWLLSPILIVPMFFTLVCIDLPLKPFRMIRSRSRALNAYEHLTKYKA